MKNTSNIYLGDTLITKDETWGGADGSHAIRPAIYLWDNGDGTAAIMKTSTAGPRNGKAARAEDRRITPDGRGRGNSMTKACDLIGGRRGIANIAISDIIAQIGTLKTEEIDWIEGRLDAMGI